MSPNPPTFCRNYRGACRFGSNLRALTKDDFKRILTEPEASLIKQYIALMDTEEVNLEFTDDAIEALADIAVDLNSTIENIGARRLQTVMERVLDDISFNAPEKSGETHKIDAQICEKTTGRYCRRYRFEPLYPVDVIQCKRHGSAFSFDTYQGALCRLRTSAVNQVKHQAMI